MTKGMQRIWRVSRLYPPNFTGAGIQAHREDQEFRELGFSVCVLAAATSEAEHQCCKTVDLDGVSVKYLPIISYPIGLNAISSRVVYKLLFLIFELFSSLFFALGCAWIILRCGSNNDILIFETLDTFTILVFCVARLRGLRTIVRMSLIGADDPYSVLLRIRKGQVWEYLRLLLFKNTDLVIAISTAMVESCRDAGLAKERVVHIPYGIDTQKFKVMNGFSKTEIRQKLALHPNKKYVIFVGSAIERKGIDILVDTFILLRENLKDVELLIVGPNEFDPCLHYNGRALQEAVTRYKNKIRNAGLNSYVHWIGQVDNVHEYMSAADVFCLPTRREGFGLVTIEAMASGLPVVIARLDGTTTDIIPSDQVGITISSYSYQDYVDAITTILLDPQKAAKMGGVASQRALLEFSLDGTIEKWLALFQELSSKFYQSG